MTDDLFAETAAEAFEERAAILEFDGLLTREKAEELGLLESEAWRDACEVRYVARLPTRKQRVEYLEGVAKKRGQASADTLKVKVEKEFYAIRSEVHVPFTHSERKVCANGEIKQSFKETG